MHEKCDFSRLFIQDGRLATGNEHSNTSVCYYNQPSILADITKSKKQMSRPYSGPTGPVQFTHQCNIIDCSIFGPPPLIVGLLKPPRPNNASMNSCKKYNKYSCILFSWYYCKKTGEKSYKFDPRATKCTEIPLRPGGPLRCHQTVTGLHWVTCF